MTELLTRPIPTPEHDEPAPKSDVETASMLERHPDWPKLDVSFYFGPHGNKEDFKGAAPHLKEADIYLMENASADSAALRKTLQSRVADTLMTPAILSQLAVEPRMRPIIKELHGTRKALGVIDLPTDEQGLRDELFTATSRGLPIADSFDETTRLMGERSAHRAELQEQREKQMLQAFESEIERILQERPELKDKPDLKVLITMGAYHTRLRHALTEADVVSKGHFSTGTTFTHGYGDQLQRTYAYGHEPSQELLETAWIEGILSNASIHAMKKYEGSSDAFSRYERALAGKLTHEQRKVIYEIVNESRSLSSEAIGKIDAYLQEKEIGKLPRSAQEVDPAFKPHRGRVMARRMLSHLMRKK